MTQKFFFQPSYVSKFKCDGSKCDARCCKAGWEISVDAETFEQYSRLPEQKIISHVHFNDDAGEYFITPNEKKICPFLNEKKLCSIQLQHGENFLSATCATYPRITADFGDFFERSLAISCPVAAQMILFANKPLKFERVDVPKNFGGKIFIQAIEATDELRRNLIDIQTAMILILQTRTLTLDRRLILLGFFIDRLEEIFSAENFDAAALQKLFTVYTSKIFLTEQIPRMFATLTFNPKNFVRLMSELLNEIFNEEKSAQDKKFLDAVIEIIPIPRAERKNFRAKYEIFLENYFVNALFQNLYPWRFEGSFMQNYLEFAAEYKILETITFSATRRGLRGKKNLLELAGWFATRFEHDRERKKKIFEHFSGADVFTTIENLLEGSD